MKKLTFLVLLSMGGVCYAHGFHAPVEPRYHVMVHVLQFLGIAIFAVTIGVIAAKRRSSR